MVKNMQEPLSAKKILLHITDVATDTTASQFTDNPFINFWNYWYGDRIGAYVDLGFDSGSLTETDLPFSAGTHNFRLDHVAKDFTLTFPTTSTNKESHLGSKDADGTPNSYLDETTPDKATIKVTINGKPSDLDKIMSTTVSSSPTGYSRYNFGARPTTRFGFIIAIVDNMASPELADGVTQLYYLHNCIVTDGGDIKADGAGNYERTLNVECDATDLYADVADGQNEPETINK